MEAAERIVCAGSARGALEAHAEFSLKLTSCKRATPAYELARRLQKQVEDFEYTLITELYARERAMLIGAELMVKSVAGAGVEVTLRLGFNGEA